MAKGLSKHPGGLLAYDAELDRIILFGGYDATRTYLNDTWAYDFNSDTWTEMKPSTSPPSRNYHAMAYDATADRVLVWDSSSVYPDDVSMWSYDFHTNTWQEMKPGDGAYPLSRVNPESGSMILGIQQLPFY